MSKSIFEIIKTEQIPYGMVLTVKCSKEGNHDLHVFRKEIKTKNGKLSVSEEMEKCSIFLYHKIIEEELTEIRDMVLSVYKNPFNLKKIERLTKKGIIINPPAKKKLELHFNKNEEKQVIWMNSLDLECEEGRFTLSAMEFEPIT